MTEPQVDGAALEESRPEPARPVKPGSAARRSLLVRRVDVDGQLLDVVVSGDRIVEVGPEAGSSLGSGGTFDQLDLLDVVDGGGGALLPGLWDHHLHLPALAVASWSVSLGPPNVTDADGFASRLGAAPADVSGWVRGVGYHESVAGPLDRHALDRIRADVAVRVQHRSGGMWVMNSRALERLASVGGVAGDKAEGPDAAGRLVRNDRWLAERLAQLRRHQPHHHHERSATGTEPGEGDLEAALADLSQRLIGFGVVGCTEATPGLTLDQAQLLERTMAPRLRLMSSMPWTGSRGEGAPAWDASRCRLGASKIMVTEDALPPLDGPDGLATKIDAAHRSGRSVAIHVVSRAALALVVAAFDQVGSLATDRIEHGSVCPPELAARVCDLGLTVVTQPNFIAERGDVYRHDVEPEDLDWLYRLAGLQSSGIPVAGGTDAPFGDPDPWAAMAAAVSRTTVDGHQLGGQEALTPEAALALFTSDPADPGRRRRTLAVGQPADLCLIDRPWSQARVDLADVKVAATIIGGHAFATDIGDGNSTGIDGEPMP